MPFAFLAQLAAAQQAMQQEQQQQQQQQQLQALALSQLYSGTASGSSLQQQVLWSSPPLQAAVGSGSTESSWGSAWDASEASALPSAVLMDAATGGLKLAPVPSSHIPTPATTNSTPTTCLRVRNLPPDATELFLYRRFSPFGALISCRLVPSPARKQCRHDGLVEFARKEDALHAQRALHGLKTSGGRKLAITIVDDAAELALPEAVTLLPSTLLTSMCAPVGIATGAPASSLA